MPLVQDECSTLVGHCVSVMYRTVECLNPEGDPAVPTVVGNVRRALTLGKTCDPNGAFITPNADGGVIDTFDSFEQVTVDGCDYWKLTTCPIPATIDTDPTDGVVRHINGSYTLSLTVNGVQCQWPIVIDAAADYTAVEDEDGCLPIKALTAIDNPDPTDPPAFNDAVCATACITDLTTQLAAIQAVIDDLTECTPDEAAALAAAIA